MGIEKLTARRSGYAAYGAGLVALDLLLSPELDGVPAYAGGTCGNVLTILAFLGWRSYPIARIGSDPAGQQLTRDLKRCGVDLSLIEVDSRTRTPIIIQQNRRGPNGDVSHRFIWQCPSCKGFLPMFRPPTLKRALDVLANVEGANVFFFDRVAAATVLFAEEIAARGALVVFEPARASDEPLFQRALAAAHIVKYAKDRVPAPRGLGKNQLLEIQTLGKDGLRFKLRGERQWVMSKASKAPNAIRDTSGAGDWTTAGIVDYLTRRGWRGPQLSECMILEAVRYGQALAAINCGFDGARGTMYHLSPKQLSARVRRLVTGGLTARKSSTASNVAQDRYSAAYCGACWPHDRMQ